jgi:hypothetical protein
MLISMAKETIIKETSYVLYGEYGELLDKGSLNNVLATLAYDIAITHRGLTDFTLKEIEIHERKVFTSEEVEILLHDFCRNIEERDPR